MILKNTDFSVFLGLPRLFTGYPGYQNITGFSAFEESLSLAVIAERLHERRPELSARQKSKATLGGGGWWGGVLSQKEKVMKLYSKYYETKAKTYIFWMELTSFLD